MIHQTKKEKDEELIRKLLEQWAHATRMGWQDEVLVNHAADVVIYDVLPPMKYEGSAAYRESWDEWQPTTTEPAIFELHELKVTTGNEVAFAYGFIHCGGTLPNGKKFEDWVRATFCLCKQNDRWTITHQHISKPLK